jgi:anti-sigma B factor antagonist
MPESVPSGQAAAMVTEVRIEAGATVVLCRGRLAAGATERFRREMKNHAASAKRLVLDLGEVTFMDSSGLGAVMAAYVSARSSGCELRIVNLTKQVRELFRMTRVLSLFEPAGTHMMKIP